MKEKRTAKDAKNAKIGGAYRVRVPEAPALLWAVLTGNKDSATGMLGIAGMTQQESEKQYRMWREQLYRGLERGTFAVRDRG